MFTGLGTEGWVLYMLYTLMRIESVLTWLSGRNDDEPKTTFRL